MTPYQRELSKKSDSQLRKIYGHYVSILSSESGDSIKRINEWYVEQWNHERSIESYTARCRKSVFIAEMLLTELCKQFNVQHIHCSPETAHWSSMEDTRFWTCDEEGEEKFVKQFLGFA